MSIKEIAEKVKPFYPLILGLLIACIFFGLGRLSQKQAQKVALRVDYTNTASLTSARGNETIGKNDTTFGPELSTSTKKQIKMMPVPSTSGEVIGSKSGKKYYFPWCGTVKRIKSENQVHFESIDQAKLAGYMPGGNCKGLY